MRYRIISILPALLLACLSSGQERPSQIPPPATFSIPSPNPVFTFPRDHGSHPDYRLEWWYLTGHLFAADGARYGFQATFFRQAGPLENTPADPAAAPENFGDRQLFLAHMAVLEVATGRFIHQERLHREGWAAAASTTGLDVRNGDWKLLATNPAHDAFHLRGSIRGEAAFDLTLTARKPLVRFGQDGYSRKGEDPTAASYYLTFTRLEAAGKLRLGSREFPVTGQAWFDHEYSSSQLDADQVGWDWISLQLLDGREIMLYQLRRRDGSASPTSRLYWVDAAGRHREAPFTFTPLSTWRSPHSGAVYPARVRLSTVDPESGQPVSFLVEPLAPDQELTGELGGIAYWEGACRVLLESGPGTPTEAGSAFMELTGYARPMDL